jgi:hypothetical protein
VRMPRGCDVGVGGMIGPHYVCIASASAVGAVSGEPTLERQMSKCGYSDVILLKLAADFHCRVYALHLQPHRGSSRTQQSCTQQ